MFGYHYFLSIHKITKNYYVKYKGKIGSLGLTAEKLADVG